VLTASRVLVSLREPKVDDVNCVLSLTCADQKVIRFYIAMDEPALMYVLNSLNHLDSNHQHRFKSELASAILE
jgi:hypothetical protein